MLIYFRSVNKHDIPQAILVSDWLISKKSSLKTLGQMNQVSVHLAKRFQRRRFLKISQSETRIAYGGNVC
jgi:hypothetical protein